MSDTRSIFLVFAIATAAALVPALLPMRVMLEHFIYEDMFYYLRVAEHIVAGKGSSFDGTAPTNGYHPAWMALSVAMASVLSGEAFVRGMLFVAVLLHGLQAAVLYRLLARHVPAILALSAVALFALNWRTIATNLCGLETPLATFVILLALERLDRWQTSGRLGLGSVAVSLGALLGLAVLARFDAALFGALALAWYGVLLLPQIGFGAALARAALAAGMAIVVVLPWLALSVSISGTPLPNSREAVKLLRDIPFPTTVDAVPGWLHEIVFGGIYWISDSANFFGVWPQSVPEGTWSNIAGLVFAIFILAVLAGAVSRRRRLPPVVWLMVVFFILHTAYYLVAHRLEVRYLMPALAALLAVLALTLAQVAPERVASGALAVLLAVATVSGIDAWSKFHGTTRTHGGHDRLYDAAIWLRENRPGAVVGAWNAGILAFFSRLEVVNLDGVINDEALAANRVRGIDDYIAVRRIEILADVESQITLNLGRFAARAPDLGDPLAQFGRVVILPLETQ